MSNALSAASTQEANNLGSVFGSAATGSKSITGTGFGVGPIVAVFDRFEDQADGQTLRTNADIGTWYSLDGQVLPPIITFNGRQGITHNDPAPSAGNTKYGMTADVADYTSYAEFYKIGVPNGRTFPGATVEDTFPGESTIKVTWHCGYTPWGVLNNANDLVSLTHVGGSFQRAGNNIAGHYINGLPDAWEWDAWNSVMGIYRTDSNDVQGPNGRSNTNMWNANGRYDHIMSPYQCWQDNNNGDALIEPLKFDKIIVLAQSGNGDHTNSQFAMTNYYLAIGDNSTKYLALANNSNITLATDVDVIPADTWSDTQITFTPSAYEAANYTHYFVMDDQVVLASGVIS